MRLLLALALAAPASAQTIQGDDARHCYQGSRSPAALIEIVGLKDRTGELRVELYPAAKDDFLTDFDKLTAERKRWHRVRLAVPGDTARVCLLAPAPGPWAIAVIHSRGGKRSFKWRTDGIGFVNNPGFGFGPPAVEKATVTFPPAVTSHRIVMKYIRGLAMRPLPGVR